MPMPDGNSQVVIHLAYLTYHEVIVNDYGLIIILSLLGFDTASNLSSHITQTAGVMSAHLQYIADERQQVCDTCGRLFMPKGFDRHRRAGIQLIIRVSQSKIGTHRQVLTNSFVIPKLPAAKYFQYEGKSRSFLKSTWFLKWI
jgi:hypothetical protein